MNMEILAFFSKMPEGLPLYESFEEMVNKKVREYTIKVQKTQIAFKNKYQFAFISLPFKKLKGRNNTYIVVCGTI